MTNELKLLNEKYAELADKKIFPFIGPNRITILDQGFYEKAKAGYRGISYIYDKGQERMKALLIGYYYVPENYVLVPEGIVMNDAKKALVQHKVAEGYKLITSAPRLVPYEFDETSEEYAIAKANKEAFNNH